jgi:hypothetical protein
MLVRSQATHKRLADRTARPGDQNSHQASLSARFAMTRSEAQVMLSCVTQRIEPPVPDHKPSHDPISCRAASRSLVEDPGLGAVTGDDVGDQPRWPGLARIGADAVVGVGRLGPALAGMVDADGLTDSPSTWERIAPEVLLRRLENGALPLGRWRNLSAT